MPTNYYKLNLASLPDDLYNKETDVKEWLALATTSTGSFPPNSLNKLQRLDLSVELERINGISLWMIGNVLPFALPLLDRYEERSCVKPLLSNQGTPIAYFFPNPQWNIT